MYLAHYSLISPSSLHVCPCRRLLYTSSNVSSLKKTHIRHVQAFIIGIRLLDSSLYAYFIYSTYSIETRFPVYQQGTKVYSERHSLRALANRLSYLLVTYTSVNRSSMHHPHKNFYRYIWAVLSFYMHLRMILLLDQLSGKNMTSGLYSQISCKQNVGNLNSIKSVSIPVILYSKSKTM